MPKVHSIHMLVFFSVQTESLQNSKIHYVLHTFCVRVNDDCMIIGLTQCIGIRLRDTSSKEEVARRATYVNDVNGT